MGLFWGSLACPAALLVLAAWWLLRRNLLLVTVHGDSMSPTYRSGDRVLVRRGRRVGVGDVVVADVTGYPLQVTPRGGSALMPSERVVKRVAATAGQLMPVGVRACRARVPPGRVVLFGDNPVASTDSRHYGPVEVDRILGVVSRRLS